MTRDGESGKKVITAMSKAEMMFTKIKSRSVLKVRDCGVIDRLISSYTAPPQPHK